MMTAARAPSASVTPDAPVVFLFPGLGGDARELVGLQRQCVAALRIVPISYPDWTIIAGERMGLDALIADCVRQIVAEAPSGALLLGGYSFGGHVALATARALVQSGREIAMLGLLDTAAFPAAAQIRLSATDRLRRMADAVTGGALPAEIGRLLAGLLLRPAGAAMLRALARRRYRRLPFGLEAHVHAPLQMRFRLPILRALLARMVDRSDPLDVPATLFRCREQSPGAEPDLGWSRYLPRLRPLAVPGHHETLLTITHLPELSAAFIATMTGAAAAKRKSVTDATV